MTPLPSHRQPPVIRGGPRQPRIPRRAPPTGLRGEGFPLPPVLRRLPSAPAESAPSGPDRSDSPREQASVTHHAIQIGGRLLRYTATAGLMPVRNEQGNLQAEIFYVAYTRDGMSPASRPITFAFNGGPGGRRRSGCTWRPWARNGQSLPKTAPPCRPRYRLLDNQHTWLGFTDLVFVDPPGTGFQPCGLRR